MRVDAAGVTVAVLERPERRHLSLSPEVRVPVRYPLDRTKWSPTLWRPRVEMRTVFPSKELRDEAVEKNHAIEGGRQTLLIRRDPRRIDAVAPAPAEAARVRSHPSTSLTDERG